MDAPFGEPPLAVARGRAGVALRLTVRSARGRLLGRLGRLGCLRVTGRGPVARRGVGLGRLRLLHGLGRLRRLGRLRVPRGDGPGRSRGMTRWGRARLGAVTGLDGGVALARVVGPVAVAVAAAVPVAGLGRLGLLHAGCRLRGSRPASRCRGRCRSRRRGRSGRVRPGNRCRRRSRHRRRRCRRVLPSPSVAVAVGVAVAEPAAGLLPTSGAVERATSRMASIAGTRASTVMSAGTAVSGCSGTVSPATIVGHQRGLALEAAEEAAGAGQVAPHGGPRVHQQEAVDDHERAQQRHADERDQRTPVLDAHAAPSRVLVPVSRARGAADRARATND